MIRSPSRAPGTPGSFTVSGIPLDSLYPRRRSLTWSQGRLSGDPVLIAARDRALALEGQDFGPEEGSYTIQDHLLDLISAATMLWQLVIPGTVEANGDVPSRGSLPPRAVG